MTTTSLGILACFFFLIAKGYDYLHSQKRLSTPLRISKDFMDHSCIRHLNYVSQSEDNAKRAIIIMFFALSFIMLFIKNSVFTPVIDQESDTIFSALFMGLFLFGYEEKEKYIRNNFTLFSLYVFEILFVLFINQLFFNPDQSLASSFYSVFLEQYPEFVFFPLFGIVLYNITYLLTALFGWLYHKFANKTLKDYRYNALQKWLGRINSIFGFFAILMLLLSVLHTS